MEVLVLEVNGSQTPVHAQVDGQQDYVVGEQVNLVCVRVRESEREILPASQYM